MSGNKKKTDESVARHIADAPQDDKVEFFRLMERLDKNLQTVIPKLERWHIRICDEGDIWPFSFTDGKYCKNNYENTDIYCQRERGLCD